MEYLMTYGWSILIIAVVLGAMFQLGVFSSANLGPRAPTGNCKILRVAGTSNLEGTCSGELPQEVAVFDGGSSKIAVSSSASLVSIASAGTIIYWMNQKSGSGPVAQIGYENKYEIGTDAPGTLRLMLNTPKSGLAADYVASGMTYNTVYQVAVTYSSPANVLTWYVNGQLVGSDSSKFGGPIAVSGVSMDFGYSGNQNAYYGGLISNVQVYNVSLDANQVQALYLKGIGAAPVDPNHIVGWWPLNGDVNDYSGNNNNGAPTAISYTSSWTSGYTPP